jgi:hypothetical protein
MPLPTKFDHIRAGFESVRGQANYGYQTILCGEWISAEMWTLSLNSSNVLSEFMVEDDVSISVAEFNKAMARDSKGYGSQLDRYKGNTNGVFRVRCGKEKGKKDGESVKYPFTSGTAPAWGKEQLKKEEGIEERLDALSQLGDELETPEAKRQRVEALTETEAVIETETVIAPVSILNQSYWDSPEAQRLFCPKETDKSVLETLQRRIKLLEGVNSHLEGWRDVIKGRDPDDICTTNDIFEIRRRCQLLCQAYFFASEGMNEISWDECCKKSIDSLRYLGNHQTKRHRTVGQWNIQFREKEEFMHPNPSVTEKDAMLCT